MRNVAVEAEMHDAAVWGLEEAGDSEVRGSIVSQLLCCWRIVVAVEWKLLLYCEKRVRGGGRSTGDVKGEERLAYDSPSHVKARLGNAQTLRRGAPPITFPTSSQRFLLHLDVQSGGSKY